MDDEEAVRIAHETVEELLQRMGIKANVATQWGELEPPGRIRPLLIDIRGDDLSILIGRRGETLSALQYITRLIVGKELKRPVAVVIDIEGYRAPPAVDPETRYRCSPDLCSPDHPDSGWPARHPIRRPLPV